MSGTSSISVCPLVDRMTDILIKFENRYCTALMVDLGQPEHVDSVEMIAPTSTENMYYVSPDWSLIGKVGIF